MRSVLSLFFRSLKTTLKSADVYGVYPKVKVEQRSPEFSFTLLLSLLYYCLVLAIICENLGLIFDRNRLGEYGSQLSQQTHGKVKYRTGYDINLTVKYLPQHLVLDGHPNQVLKDLVLTDGNTIVQFGQVSHNHFQAQYGKTVELGTLSLRHLSNSFRPEEVNISFRSLKNTQDKIRQFTIKPYNFLHNQSSQLVIYLDESINYEDNSFLPWHQIKTTPGLLQGATYDIQPTQNNTYQSILRLASKTTGYSKLNVSYKLYDLLANVGCIVCLVHFLSFFLLFECITRSEYLGIASRLYILKYAQDRSLVYENISGGCAQFCKRGKGIGYKLAQKSIRKLKQNFDVCHIIKQLRNIQVLVGQNQIEVGTAKLRKTMATVNSYSLSALDKQKILQFMQLEEIATSTSLPDLLKSPLTASIFHKLKGNDHHDTHFLSEASIGHFQPESKSLLRRLVTWFYSFSNEVLTQVDMFSFRVGFFFDQTSLKVKSSFSGFINCLSIWLVIIVTFQLTIGFLAGTGRLYSYSMNQVDGNRSITYGQVFMFVQNSTSKEYVPFPDISRIVTIVSNVNGSSFVLSPVQEELTLLGYQGMNQFGGVFRLHPNISPSSSSFNLQFSYVCPGNNNCEQTMYGLHQLTFHLLLPETELLTSAKSKRNSLTPYRFKYEYTPQKPRQSITILIDETKFSFDQSLLPFTSQSIAGFKLSQQQGKTQYLSNDRAATTIDFVLADNILTSHLESMSVDQYVGCLGGVWLLVSVLGSLIGKYINKLSMKMQLVYGKDLCWRDLIIYICTKALGRFQYKACRLLSTIHNAQNKGSEMFSAQKICKRLQIIEQYIQSYSPSENERILLSTYLKQETLKTKTSVNWLPMRQLPLVRALPSCGTGNVNLEDIQMYRHPVAKPHPVAKSLWRNLNRLNLFDQEVVLNYKGNSKISSPVTKLCTLMILGILASAFIFQISAWQQRRMTYQSAEVIVNPSHYLSGKFRLCLNLKRLPNIQDTWDMLGYVRFELLRNANMQALSNKQGSYCFESENSSRIFPFSIRVGPNEELSDQPYFQQQVLKFLQSYEYQLCLSNSHPDISPPGTLQCNDFTRFKQNVAQFASASFKPRIHNGSMFLDHNWNNVHKTYFRRGKQFLNYQFQIQKQGVAYSAQKGSFMVLVRKLVGLIFIALLMVPLGKKYNQTKFVLLLSKDLFIEAGSPIKFDSIDVALVMVASNIQLKILMTRRIQQLLKIYNQSRGALSYKNFIYTLTVIEQKVSSETDPSFTILLRTYIKPEIYLQSNINKDGYRSKIDTISRLRETYTYKKLKELGLSDDEALAVISAFQTTSRISSKEVQRRMEFFRSQLALN